MQYDFDQVVDRRPTDSIKWNTYDQDALPMWVADMDFPCPDPVIRALRQRIDHGIFGYPVGVTNSPGELTELRGTIVDRMARLYDWSIQPEDIVFIPGVVIAFNLACHALATPEQAVLVQTPVYTPILTAAQETGALGQEVELIRQPDGILYRSIGIASRPVSPHKPACSSCVTHTTRSASSSSPRSSGAWPKSA